MREVFESVFNNYISDYNKVQQIYSEKTFEIDGSTVANMAKFYSVELLEKFKSYTKGITDGYTVKFFVQTRKWTHIPFICVMDPDVAKKPNAGYYFVYLFKKDMTGVYLSLNFGAKSFTNIDEMYQQHLTSYWQQFLTNFSGRQGFNMLPIDINASTRTTEGYEQRHIIGKYYSAKALPDNNVLLNDLNYMIQIYNAMKEHINEHEGNINEINEQLVQFIQAQGVVKPLQVKEKLVGKFFGDNIGKKDKDLLNIKSDANSLAKLITLKDLNHPISIGLFGKWGSGKSFLLKKIQEEVSIITKSISDNNSDKFWKNVVQIEFNAWHYMDSNLWASLVTHILEITAYCIENGCEALEGPEIKCREISKLESDLFTKLNISKSNIDSLNINLDNIKGNIDIYEKELRDKVSEIGRIEANPEYILKEMVIKDIKKEIDKKIKSEYKDFLEIDSINDFCETARESKKAITTIINIFNSTLKNWRFVAAIVITFIITFSIVIAPEVLKGTNSAFSYIMSKLKENVAAYFTPLVSLLWPIKNALKKVNKYSDYIKSLAQKQISEEKKKKLELANNLNKLNLEKILLEGKIKCEKDESNNIENKISEIKSGLYLKDFLNQRINDTYKEHLGLINIIRSDFEFIDSYIKTVQGNVKNPVDKIILYIDDLDRCNANRVVEVLQAIHLLLSFNIFAVVLAVDIRWVSKCLKTHYKELFIEDESCNSEINAASTYDYLEKIIQIPVKVKALNDKMKSEYMFGLVKGLISDYDENEIEDSSRAERNGIPSNPEISEGLNEQLLPDSNAIEEIAATNEIQNNEVDDFSEMKLTMNEMEKIDKFAHLVGDTPRTIKRFTNIFLLLKSNGEVNNENIKFVLLLLSIVTGMPHSSARIMSYILGCLERSITVEYISTMIFPEGSKSNSEIVRFIELLDKNPDLKNIHIIDLKPYVNSVSRFSFYSDNINNIIGG